jgi:hypothetical protein
MAFSLAATITGSDSPIALSADPGSPYIRVDAEQMLVTQHASGPTRSIPSVDPSNPSGSGTYGNAIVSVARGQNGTDPAPHNAGATVTALWYSLTATAGATV